LGIPAAIIALLLRQVDDSKDRVKTGAAALGAAAMFSASPAVAANLAPVREAVPLMADSSRVGYVAAVADDEGPLTTFFGLDTPPTSYGGYGGNANEKPRYRYDKPDSWKFQIINKVQKGTQGVDSRFISPNNRDEQCFAITLARAGESLNFQIRDVDSTFRGFAGADYDIADSLENADEIIKGTREIEGQTYYDYDIVSENRYLATVTVSRGKVYAFFVKAPMRLFQANEAMYRQMLASFKTLEVENAMIAGP
jgi:hypothetical protein